MNGRRRSGGEVAVNLLAPPAAFALAWVLSIGNGDGEPWLTIANVASVMAVLTVGAALLDWVAGRSGTPPQPQPRTPRTRQEAPLPQPILTAIAGDAAPVALRNLVNAM